MQYGFASDNHKEFPPMVVVSIVNICNLRCIHCHYPLYIKNPAYRPHMMEWNVWKQICDEMKDYPWSILNLGTDGEPLIHKQFLEMTQYAKGVGIYPITITTNGLLLKPRLSEAIVKEGLLDVINISLDALDGETYRHIRGGNYDEVLDNIDHLIDLRQRFNPGIKIQVNIIDQPEVRFKIEAFVEHWRARVDHVMVRTYYDATHLTGATGPNLTGKQKPFEPVERWPCQQFWRRFNIADDGTARFCVDDWYNQTRIGDLSESSIREIWQSETYHELRVRQLQGEFHKIPYCAKCTEWQGMRWDYDYFVALEKMTGKKFI